MTDDFSIVMDTGLEKTKVYEANYPENLGRIFVINGIIIGIKFKRQTKFNTW